MSSITLYMGAINMAWLLQGSLWDGQAVLYLFQRHLPCWEDIHSFSHCGNFWNKPKMFGGISRALPHYQLVSFPPHQQLASALVTIALISGVLKRTTATSNTED